jgi:hypothetical protein
MSVNETLIAPGQSGEAVTPAAEQNGYAYTRADGTVERATSAAEAIGLCPVLGDLAIKAPGQVELLLSLAATGPENPTTQTQPVRESPEAKQDVSTTKPALDKPMKNDVAKQEKPAEPTEVVKPAGVNIQTGLEETVRQQAAVKVTEWIKPIELIEPPAKPQPVEKLKDNRQEYNELKVVPSAPDNMAESLDMHQDRSESVVAVVTSVQERQLPEPLPSEDSRNISMTGVVPVVEPGIALSETPASHSDDAVVAEMSEEYTDSVVTYQPAETPEEQEANEMFVESNALETYEPEEIEAATQLLIETIEEILAQIEIEPISPSSDGPFEAPLEILEEIDELIFEYQSIAPEQREEFEQEITQKCVELLTSLGYERADKVMTKLIRHYGLEEFVYMMRKSKKRNDQVIDEKLMVVGVAGNDQKLTVRLALARALLHLAGGLPEAA